MHHKIKIIYTSDTHGRLSAYDFLNQSNGPFGLSRLSSYLKQEQCPYLLLDNGDFLQGSPLLDYTRKNQKENPVAKVFNELGVVVVTVGNHDFNFGLPYLLDFQKQYQGNVLCANIIEKGHHLFKPFDIIEIDGVRIAVIGVTTEYIPFWEKPEHIEGLTFEDVTKTVSDVISLNQLKMRSDVIVVLYHGGFAKDLKTHVSYGAPTIENKGYELFQNQDIDILLTGHQHIPMVFKKEDRVALQTAHNARNFGVITIEQDEKGKIGIHADLVEMSAFPVDIDIEKSIESEIDQTNRYLSKPIGIAKTNMRIHDPLSCRIRKHPLFQMINQIQMSYTDADLSIASLPNETHGFNHEITLNDIAINFPFENDLVVLEMNGSTLKKALEKNAEYFSLEENKIVINPNYLYPKVEHYNYDVYEGIDYIIDVSQPLGKRIVSLKFQNKDVSPEQWFTVAVNSYRAVGSGGFDMFKDARKVISYPVSYFDLISSYVEKEHKLDFEVIDNYKVIQSESK